MNHPDRRSRLPLRGVCQSAQIESVSKGGIVSQLHIYILFLPHRHVSLNRIALVPTQLVANTYARSLRIANLL